MGVCIETNDYYYNYRTYRNKAVLYFFLFEKNKNKQRID